MKKTLLLFVLFTIYISYSDCYTTLPSYLKTCSRSDPKLKECMIKNGIEAIPSLIKGDPAYHIPSFDPFRIDKVNLEASDSIKLYGTNISIVGINLIELKDISWDMEKQRLYMKLFTPLLRILGTYNMNGHILILTLKGSGAMNNSHYNNDINLNLKYNVYKKNDVDFYKLEDFDIIFKFRSTNFYFENILDNPVLSKQINGILNENSDVLIKELFISIKEIIINIAKSIIEPIIDKVPADNIIRP